MDVQMSTYLQECIGKPILKWPKKIDEPCKVIHIKQYKVCTFMFYNSIWINVITIYMHRKLICIYMDLISCIIDSRVHYYLCNELLPKYLQLAASIHLTICNVQNKETYYPLRIIFLMITTLFLRSLEFDYYLRYFKELQFFCFCVFVLFCYFFFTYAPYLLLY